MSLYGQFETNKDLEESGVAITLDEAEGPLGVPTFYLARMSNTNKAYTKAIEVATRPFRRQIELNTFKNEKAEEIMLSVFVDKILRGWKFVSDRNGKVIEFSKENAIKLLTDLPDLYVRLQTEAKEISNFKSAALEEEAKN